MNSAIDFTFDVRGVPEVAALLNILPAARTGKMLLAEVNRAAKKERNVSSREIASATRIRVGRIKERVLVEMKTTSVMLRFRGHPAKKEQAWLRPSYMRPIIPERKEQTRDAQSGRYGGAVAEAGRRGRKRNRNVVWGSGIFPRVNEPGGFFVNVRAGRQIIQSSHPSFDPEKAVLFIREQPKRVNRKIKNRKGYTVGYVARQIGLAPRAAQRIQEDAAQKFRERLLREIRAASNPPALEAVT